MADSGKQKNSSADESDFVSLEGLDSVAPVVESPEEAAPSESPEPEEENSAFEHYQASQDEVDQFLAEEEGEFLSSLKDLKKIPSEGGEELASIEIDPNLLKEEKPGRWDALLQKLAPIFTPYYFLKGLGVKSLLKIKDSGRLAKEGLAYLKSEGIPKLKENSKKFAESVKKPAQQFWLAAKGMSWKGRLLLVAALSMLIALGVLFPVLYSGSFLPDPERQDIASFDTVASSLEDAHLTQGTEAFDSPIRHPEYVVLLKRVVVNLRRPFRSNSNPMGLFEFYVEAANQETAVEIREREVEVLDLVQRTVEAMTYPELNGIEGKQRMKVAIRRDLNQVMTKGRIKRVYIKTMTLKP